VAVTADGRELFIKVLGPDQRQAELLYRGYRAVRLEGVGDRRPAASLRQAVEHQALVGLVAERAGVGIHANIAVPVVITYRLATYWLPIAPGWACLQLLQRRDLL
jgi:hypothetical protein